MQTTTRRRVFAMRFVGRAYWERLRAGLRENVTEFFGPEGGYDYDAQRDAWSHVYVVDDNDSRVNKIVRFDDEYGDWVK